MDKQVQKLKNLLDKNIHKSKNEILKVFGRPSRKSDSEVWFYRRFGLSLFSDEIVFIFEEDRVVEISLTQYFLLMERKNVYYFKGQNPEYKVVCS